MSVVSGLVLVAGLALGCLPWSAVRHPLGGVVGRSEARGGGSAGAAAAGWAGPRVGAGATRAGTAVAGGAVVDRVDAAALLDLVRAALTTGASVPRALTAVGRAIGGPDGERLDRAGTALPAGATWAAAWGAPPGLDRPAGRRRAGEAWEPLADALELVWTTGAAPSPILRAHADAIRARRRAVARAAAARLGVRLALPLGLCFLPAFVLLGLLPVVLGMVGGVR